MVSRSSSQWNCRPNARRPMRNAWCRQTGVDARWTAPRGRSNVSPCQCSTSWPRGQARQRRLAAAPATRSTGPQPTSRAGHRLAVRPGTRVRVDARARRRGQQLRAQADAEHRRVARDAACAAARSRREEGIRGAPASATPIGPPMTISIWSAPSVVRHGGARVERARRRSRCRARPATSRRAPALRSACAAGRSARVTRGSLPNRAEALQSKSSHRKPDAGSAPTRRAGAVRARSRRCGSAGHAVFRVADDRVARGGQVRAHLVGSAGVQSRTRSSAVAARRSITIHVGLGRQRLPAAADPDARATAADPADRARLAARVRGRRPHHLREVGLLAAVGGQRGAQLRPDARAARGDQHAAGAGVQAMDQPALARIGRRGPRIRGSARPARWRPCRARRARSGCDGMPAGLAIATSASSSCRTVSATRASGAIGTRAASRRAHVRSPPAPRRRSPASRRPGPAWRPCAGAGRRCGRAPAARAGARAATLSPGMAAATA